MIRLVETENSTYEIDVDLSRIRRIRGDAPPTERQGPDRVWKHYHHLSFFLGCYLIEWDDQGHSTMTSRVISDEPVSPMTGAKTKAVS